MTNTPALRSISGPPSLPEPELLRSIAYIGSSIASYSSGDKLLDPGRAPSQALRDALTARSDEIERSLGHRDAGAVSDALKILFASTKSSREDRLSPDDLVEIYAAALGDLPSWAVVECCHQFIRGTIGGGSLTFAPAAPEIHQGTRNIIRQHVAERAQIVKILALSLPPPLPSNSQTEQERRAAHVAAAVKKLAANFAMDGEAQT